MLTQFGIEKYRSKVDIFLKVSVNSTDFTCLSFWAQTVLILLAQNFSILLEHNDSSCK